LEQNDDDHAFNFRIRGHNMDFMSYSMLSLANNDKRALLDPKTFIEKANTVFGVFFKHWASENVTMGHGGLAYQPIGATLPPHLGKVVSGNTAANEGYNGTSASSTPQMAQVVIHMPVEQLIMSPAAVYLSLIVLVFLCLTTIVIYAFYRNRFKALPRDVDTLASVLGFVYGSERLLEWVGGKKDSGALGDKAASPQADEKMIKARFGPFETGTRSRWGVELVDNVELEPLVKPKA
jgi:hypothetical protein